MAKQPTPQWQPLEKLPFIAWAIDGMLESAEENYANLQPARKRPSMLDDYTVGRVIEVYTTQRDDLWLYDEQLKRWAALSLTAARRQEVTRLTAQMKRLHEVLTTILALADELKEGTIEKVLAKSDAEVGLEFLLGLLGEQRDE
jgi:hypothetical protein